MFSLFGKKDKSATVKTGDGIPPVILQMRETLYSTASLEPMLSRVKDDAKTVFPWSNFIEANQALKKNDKARAITLLKQIVDTDGLNTRIYLQAWHTLMSLNEQPPESLRGVIQGVVTEYHMDKGLDIVAAYTDRTARYWNYSGAGIVWETRDPEIDKLIEDLLKVGQEIMNRIGAEPRENLPIPTPGKLRIFLMAYDGSSFGEGLYDQLIKDQMGNYAINASYNLMMGLMKKQENSRKSV
jgi:hypothetical protein